jgi:hypothetical protein
VLWQNVDGQGAYRPNVNFQIVNIKCFHHLLRASSTILILLGNQLTLRGGGCQDGAKTVDYNFLTFWKSTLQRRTKNQGSQMVYFQAKNTNLGKFWKAL